MGALLVPSGSGGVAVAAIALDRHSAVAMPFPVAWDGAGRVGRFAPASPGFDEATAMARSALRIAGLALEVARAVEAGSLWERPGPDFSRESAERARRGKPPLLDCALLGPALDGAWEVAGSLRTLGWVAVADPDGRLLEAAAGRLTREAADHGAALAEERLEVARWSLGRRDLGEAEAMALQVAEVAASDQGAASRLAARLVERVGSPVLGLVPRAGGCAIEAIPVAGDAAGDGGRRAAEAWLAARG